MSDRKASSNRNLAYITIIAVALLGALYFAFFRGSASPQADPSTSDRVTQIQNSAPTDAQRPPDLPVEKRSPRGAIVPK